MPKSTKNSQNSSKSSKLKKTDFKLRPSESHRWMHCTASPFFIAENAEKIDDSESVYAAEGTLAHEKAAESLLMGFDASDFEDKEMAEHVKNYDQFCRKQIEDGDKLYVEKTVPLFFDSDESGTTDSDESGTTDCAIAHIEGKKLTKLRINDLKYGAGVSVQAKNNPQVAIYALSVMEELMRSLDLECDWKTLITIAVYQPRIVGEKAIRLWALTYQELVEFCLDISKKADHIRSAKTWDDVEFKPSEETCRFCDAKPFCGHYAGYLLGDFEVDEIVEEHEEGEQIVSKPIGIQLRDPSTLTPTQVSNLVQLKPELVKWLNALEEYAKLRIENGIAIPGLKVVQGQKGNRQYRDEKKAEKFLTKHIPKKDRVTTKVISPAQAEKYLKDKDLPDEFWEEFKSHIVRHRGGHKLVLESDPRKPVVLSLAEEFDFVNEDKSLLD